MPYVYFECENHHIYRALQSKVQPPTTCPYCESEWRSSATKAEWIQFRIEFWDKTGKYHKD